MGKLRLSVMGKEPCQLAIQCFGRAGLTQWHGMPRCSFQGLDPYLYRSIGWYTVLQCIGGMFSSQ